jgi:thioredoxin-like negative regulator of GroEL
MFSKIANAVVWTALAIVVVVLVYKNTDWFKPAADKALEDVKAVISKVPTGSFGKSSAVENLTKAREAFARGDVNGAVSMYSECIKSNADDTDARGELGNVYYTTGRMQEAAQTYYDTAKLLLAKNEIDRVEALLPVIDQINPALVDDLMPQLHNAIDKQMMANQPQAEFPQQTPQQASQPVPQQAPQSALTRH